MTIADLDCHATVLDIMELDYEQQWLFLVVKFMVKKKKQSNDG